MDVSTWLITGASSGFGRELTRQLLGRGRNVAVTARRAADIEDLVALAPSRALGIELDVTRPDHIEHARMAIDARFGGIDVLVNNAGYGYRAAVEEGEEEQVRRMFDTNVFGLMAVTPAFLPGMREKRKGTIVNISSIGGRSVPAGSGYYGASKFAVEGFSDALRQEVEPLGLRVLVVEPSAFRTDFASRSLQQSSAEITAYAATAGRRRKRPGATHAQEPGDPVRAASAIIDTLDARHPPFRLLLGREAVRRARLALEEQRAELERWEQVSVDADFPLG